MILAFALIGLVLSVALAWAEAKQYRRERAWRTRCDDMYPEDYPEEG